MYVGFAPVSSVEEARHTFRKHQVYSNALEKTGRKHFYVKVKLKQGIHMIEWKGSFEPGNEYLRSSKLLFGKHC